jgi:hypothetical protein
LKRTTLIVLASVLVAVTLIAIGTMTFIHDADAFPFRCSTSTHYDLSRKEGSHNEFALIMDLRFQDKTSGYLLLNGQVNYGNVVATLNRRIILNQGDKIDYDTYHYHIENIVTSPTDNTPDAVFNDLLAELTLDPSYLQWDVVQVDTRTYLIGGPLSYLFTCQRY